MPKLPSVTGREVIRALEKADFLVVRVSGSHHNMKRQGHPLVLTVPVHGNEPVKTGTLRSLIRNAGLTVEQFVDLLG